MSKLRAVVIRSFEISALETHIVMPKHFVWRSARIWFFGTTAALCKIGGHINDLIFSSAHKCILKGTKEVDIS